MMDENDENMCNRTECLWLTNSVKLIFSFWNSPEVIVLSSHQDQSIVFVCVHLYLSVLCLSLLRTVNRSLSCTRCPGSGVRPRQSLRCEMSHWDTSCDPRLPPETCFLVASYEPALIKSHVCDFFVWHTWSPMQTEKQSKYTFASNLAQTRRSVSAICLHALCFFLFYLVWLKKSQQYKNKQ